MPNRWKGSKINRHKGDLERQWAPFVRLHPCQISLVASKRKTGQNRFVIFWHTAFTWSLGPTGKESYVVFKPLETRSLFPHHNCLYFEHCFGRLASCSNADWSYKSRIYLYSYQLCLSLRLFIQPHGVLNNITTIILLGNTTMWLMTLNVCAVPILSTCRSLPTCARLHGKRYEPKPWLALILNAVSETMFMTQFTVSHPDFSQSLADWTTMTQHNSAYIGWQGSCTAALVKLRLYFPALRGESGCCCRASNSTLDAQGKLTLLFWTSHKPRPVCARIYSIAQTLKSWQSCAGRVSASHRNTSSEHHPRSWRVTASEVGVKKKKKKK